MCFHEERNKLLSHKYTLNTRNTETIISCCTLTRGQVREACSWCQLKTQDFKHLLKKKAQTRHFCNVRTFHTVWKYLAPIKHSGSGELAFFVSTDRQQQQQQRQTDTTDHFILVHVHRITKFNFNWDEFVSSDSRTNPFTRKKWDLLLGKMVSKTEKEQWNW